jgi:hypothetical protein
MNGRARGEEYMCGRTQRNRRGRIGEGKEKRER